MHNVTLQPIPVLSDGGRHEGRLVLVDGNLVAVFVQVTAEEVVGGRCPSGGWFLEAGFGPCGDLMSATQPVLATLEEAVDWVKERLEARIDPAGQLRSD